MALDSRANSIALHLAGEPSRTRVVVAMSGGVDSSVVAGLLKLRGYDVVGITLQLYDHGAAVGRKGACCAGQDIMDARAVADRLGIPHYVLDYEERFSASVIAGFADSYLQGETPVPCVSCNQKIKFHDLLNVARELGADALATGHYVESRPGRRGFELYRAADAERDQSYFLFATTQAQLDLLRFPLGGLPKAEVRALARELGLEVADKADSQDICFVPQGRYADVIQRLRPDAVEAGEIVHCDGRVLGRHEGIVNFTVGQRRGLKIAAGEPLFVVRLDAERRQVVVGPRSALEARRIALKDVNWLGDERLEQLPAGGIEIAARIRSSSPTRSALLRRRADGRWEVVLATSEHGVSPGQACVLYADEGPRARVLGGGWITGSDALAARPLPERTVVAHP